MPYLDTSRQQMTLNGYTPRTVMIDTGAKPVMIGSGFAAQIGLTKARLSPAPYQIFSATEIIESVLGVSSDPIEFVFSTGSATDTTSICATVLVPKAQDYDVLLGQDVLFQIGAVVDHWQGQFLYHPDYRTYGVRLAAIPLLRPQISPYASRHCVPVCSIVEGPLTLPTPFTYDSNGDEEESVEAPLSPTIQHRARQAAPAFRRLVIRAAELYSQAANQIQPVQVTLPPFLPSLRHSHLRPICQQSYPFTSP